MKKTNIRINKKYKLCLLKNFRHDNTDFLKKEKGIYICNFPEKSWYRFNDITQKRNYSIEKKINIFNLMSKESLILSPTIDCNNNKKTTKAKFNNIYHLRRISTSQKLSQIYMIASAIKFLFLNRRKYKYVLSYNFDLPNYIPGLMAKLFLGKKLYIDFEDDYSINDKYKKFLYTNFLFHIPDKVICVNENMEKHFSCETYVINAFNSLSIPKDKQISLFENVTFFISGGLDDIRGGGLIPDVIIALRSYKFCFKIILVGTGMLEDEIKSWKYPELEYFGYVDNEKYSELIDQSDYCLVLQKPDHPFNLGSFPSKIDHYSEYNKTILILENF